MPIVPAIGAAPLICRQVFNSRLKLSQNQAGFEKGSVLLYFGCFSKFKQFLPPYFGCFYKSRKNFPFSRTPSGFN
jgi:hypothetical protein